MQLLKVVRIKSWNQHTASYQVGDKFLQQKSGLKVYFVGYMVALSDSESIFLFGACLVSMPCRFVYKPGQYFTLYSLVLRPFAV